MNNIRVSVLTLSFVGTIICGSIASTVECKALPIKAYVTNDSALQKESDLTIRDSLTYVISALEESVWTIQELQKKQQKLSRDYANLSKICLELKQREALFQAALDSSSALLLSLQDSLSASRVMFSDMHEKQISAKREQERLRKVDFILIAFVLILLCLVIYMMTRILKTSRIQYDSKKTTTDEKLPEAISPKFDPVSYDAAVDAWIHINNNLATLGKYRWKIQKVYAYLAGYDIDKAEIQHEMAEFDDEHKEAVTIIVSDIERFKVQHLAAMENGLTIQSGHKCALKEAVRFPVNQIFDDSLDEELTGDPVNEGAVVSKVASLGYFFPGSRNGCYRVKSKVLI